MQISEDLEKIVSLSGHLVWKVNDKLTASSRDPIKEANLWVEQLGPVDSRTLIIGGGSGYHIQSLYKKTNVPFSVLEFHSVISDSLFEVNKNIPLLCPEKVLTKISDFDRFYIFRPATQWCLPEVQKIVNKFRVIDGLDHDTQRLTSILLEMVR